MVWVPDERWVGGGPGKGNGTSRTRAELVGHVARAKEDAPSGSICGPEWEGSRAGRRERSVESCPSAGPRGRWGGGEMAAVCGDSGAR